MRTNRPGGREREREREWSSRPGESRQDHTKDEPTGGGRARGTEKTKWAVLHAQNRNPNYLQLVFPISGGGLRVPR